MPMKIYKILFLLLWITVFLIPQVVLGQIKLIDSVECDTEETPSRSLLQQIEGVWISDVYTNEESSGLPSYVLVVHNGEARLDMIGYGYAETLVKNSPSDMPKKERTIAQRIEDVNSSLYIAWSNERLKVPNQAIASGLGQTGGDVAYEITKQGTSELFGNSFVGELSSDLVSGVVSSVISSMIVDAFAPSKRINVLEMTIQQDNECELTAHAYIQEIKIKGQEQPLVIKSEETIHFTKYDPASGVFFDIPFEQKIYVPGEGFLKVIPPKYQEIGKSYLRYYDLKVPTHISQETTLPYTYYTANPFNIFQNKKIQYYNEQRVLSLGYNHSESKAYLGAQMKIIENKKGCYVDNVSPLSPAFLFNIQEGDCLLNIDGFEIETPEQAEKYIESLKPYEWITIRLKRGRKIFNIDVELSKL